MLIAGKVVKGRGAGKKLGFPTINVLTQEIHLDFGVYAARVYTPFGIFKGAAHFGPRKIFNIEKPELEVHLLDFDGNLYDSKVTVEILQKVRETAHFEKLEDLINQITADIEKVKNMNISTSNTYVPPPEN